MVARGQRGAAAGLVAIALACGGESSGDPTAAVTSITGTASTSGVSGGGSTSSMSNGTDADGSSSGPGSGGAATSSTTGVPPGGSPSPGCGEVPPATAPTAVTVDGEVRTFILEVPQPYDPGGAYPLILGWHGTGHQGADARAQMQLFEGAGGNAIVAYPDGAAQAPVWSFPGGANVVDEQRDLKLFDALVEAVGEQYCIDGDRIFSTGFSQGAFFTNALGCERPWVVDGIAPVGGGGPWQCDATGMAAMIIIGTNDDVSGANNPYGYGNSAQMSRDFWLGGNGCSDPTMPVDPSPCVAYACPDRPVVYCEFNGGHTWWANATPGMLLFFDSL